MAANKICSLFCHKYVWKSILRSYSTSLSCKVLVVGGGTGGCSVAAKFTKHLNKNEVIIVEPREKHWYEPMFTLVGAGIKEINNAWRFMKDVLPVKAMWIQEQVTEYDPDNNTVLTSGGKKIKYDFLVVCVGVKPKYEKIPGLLEGLDTPGSGVCTTYSFKYAPKVYLTIQNFTHGNAIFTYPKTPIKCPGASLKIMYLTEHYLQKVKKRDKAEIIYMCSTPFLFAIVKYEKLLLKIISERNIHVELRTNLVEVNSKEKKAVFKNLITNNLITKEYTMLCAAPPHYPPTTLTKSKLANSYGYLEVHKAELQHPKYSNVFGIGDCIGTPNSKTGSAIGVQSAVVYKNIMNLSKGKPVTSEYDGYAACPVITRYGRCIMAEYDYSMNPKETFPFNQATESRLMYIMKKDVFPLLYWHISLKGNWSGPDFLRKLFHLFLV